MRNRFQEFLRFAATGIVAGGLADGPYALRNSVHCAQDQKCVGERVLTPRRCSRSLTTASAKRDVSRPSVKTIRPNDLVVWKTMNS